MNLLDENIPGDQRELLSGWRIRFREIGLGIGHLGMKDSEIIPVLHALKSPTFFTLDSDFYERHLCHPGYCLVYLDVEDDEAAPSFGASFATRLSTRTSSEWERLCESEARDCRFGRCGRRESKN